MLKQLNIWKWNRARNNQKETERKRKREIDRPVLMSEKGKAGKHWVPQICHLRTYGPKEKLVRTWKGKSGTKYGQSIWKRESNLPSCKLLCSMLFLMHHSRCPTKVQTSDQGIDVYWLAYGFSISTGVSRSGNKRTNAALLSEIRFISL